MEMVEQTRSLEACIRSCLVPGEHFGEANVRANDLTSASRYACNNTDACRVATGIKESPFPLPKQGYVGVCTNGTLRWRRGCITHRNGEEAEGTCSNGECVLESEAAMACWRDVALDLAQKFEELAQRPLLNTLTDEDRSSWATRARRDLARDARGVMRCTARLPFELSTRQLPFPHWDGTVPVPSRMPDP
jgi:hypothetical protein